MGESFILIFFILGMILPVAAFFIAIIALMWLGEVARAVEQHAQWFNDLGVKKG